MSLGTGRSAAKRAKARNSRLKKYVEDEQQLNLTRDFRDISGTVGSMTGAYGLAGAESSGFHAAQGAAVQNYYEASETSAHIKEEKRLVNKDMEKAKSKAGSFKIGMAVLSAVTMGAAGALGAAAGTAASAASGSVMASSGVLAAGTSASAAAALSGAAATAGTFGGFAASIGLTSMTSGLAASQAFTGLAGSIVDAGID